MAAQFIHYSVYGRVPKKGALKFQCITGILAEASRLPGATKHLGAQADRSPRLLFGVMPIELDGYAHELAENALDVAGRRVRADANVLVAGVVSYPTRVAEHDADQLEAWLIAVLDWLKKTHGSRLRSIVVHMDELFYHAHFFALPELRPDGTLDWVNTHPGLEKKRFAWLHGESAVMQDRCYRSAMEDMQTDFYEHVGRHFSHERFGPRRQRVDRREAKMRQQLDDERRAALDDIERRKKSLDAHEAFLRRRVAEIRAAIEKNIERLPGIRMSGVERLLARDQARNALADLPDFPERPAEEVGVFALP